MNIIKRILREETLAQENVMETMFAGMEKKKTSLYPASIFLYKDGKIHFEIDTQNKNIWYIWYDLLNLIQLPYNMDENELVPFLVDMCEKHIGIKGYTPKQQDSKQNKSWKKIEFYFMRDAISGQALEN